MPYGKNAQIHAAHQPARSPKLRRAIKKMGMQAKALSRQFSACTAKIDPGVWTPNMRKRPATINGYTGVIITEGCVESNGLPKP